MGGHCSSLWGSHCSSLWGSHCSSLWECLHSSLWGSHCLSLWGCLHSSLYGSPYFEPQVHVLQTLIELCHFQWSDYTAVVQCMQVVFLHYCSLIVEGWWESKNIHVQCQHFTCRSESPSQGFLIAIQWLFHVLKNVPESEWGQTVLAYDNICHLDGLKAAQEDLPLPPPMSKNVDKIIDSLHIRNHIDPKCQDIYHPKRVKEKNPHFN